MLEIRTKRGELLASIPVVAYIPSHRDRIQIDGVWYEVLQRREFVVSEGQYLLPTKITVREQ